VVNQVSKQPRLITEHEVNATGTNNYVRLQGDFNLLEGDAALRVNAMTTDSDGDNAGAETHRRGLALDYRYGIGHRQRDFRSACTHLHYNDKPDWGLCLAQRPPCPIAHQQVLVWADTDFQNEG
jgi:catecholate siderophore receptor